MASTSDDQIFLKRPLYVYDLPPELLSTLRFKSGDDVGTSIADSSRTASTSARTSGHNLLAVEAQVGGTTTATSCSTCGVSFTSVQEQRSHVRSDFHGYNLKLKVSGLQPVNEVDFERLVGELDESISGSDTSDSESDAESGEGTRTGGGETLLSALLRRQANLGETDTVETGKSNKRGSGKAPLWWFKSSTLPSNTSLGIYRAIFTNDELQDQFDLVEVVRQKQLALRLQPHYQESEGGVRLPQAQIGPHVFLCMIGGGHFAGMVVSLTPKVGKKQGNDERQATVLAHKTFHRYTTRRKQGGAQSANDAAKGNAHSAGSSLRRYNEAALETDIRTLLREWKDLITTSELLFIRATGTTNRRILFGPYDGQVLRQNDSRLRGFPFSTRRATQAELMRAFVELTRVKINQVDEAALEAAAQAKAAEEEAQQQAAAAKARTSSTKAVPDRSTEDEAALLHTMQLEALVRRSKIPAILSYFPSNNLSSDFMLFPRDTQAHYHAPTVLHLASSMNSPALVTALLVKGGADPTITSREGKTAFDIAGDRPTRDAFRLSRSELGDKIWQWDSAHVPGPLTKNEIDARNQQEKDESAKNEELRRNIEMDRIREEEQRKQEERRKGTNDRREKTMGKGKKLSTAPMTAEQRREEESRGMTPEMKLRLEREKRARAAEERMKKLQGASGSHS